MSARPKARPAGHWARLWQPFWALPSALAGSSLLLGLAVPRFDDAQGSPLPWVFRGGTEGARTLLSTIAGATISVTGLVFSITIVVLQLASSQFTPRVLGTFLDSRITQATLGVFTGSFLYALTVLRTVRSAETAPVPHTAVGLAYLYVVGTVVAFVWFVHHVTASVQVSHVLHRVRDDATAAVRRVHPAEPSPSPAWAPPPAAPSATVTSRDRSGHVTRVDGAGLVELARSLDGTFELDVGPGDFIVPGARLGRLWGASSVSDRVETDLLDRLALSRERAPDTDPAFGARQLVDIAERALSPATNDPTTAVQAIDQLHILLRAMAVRADPPQRLLDEDSVVRVVYRPRTFGGVLREAVEELAWYGRDAVRILPRLEGLLDDLATAARPEHRPAVDAARRTLQERTV